MLLLLAEQTKHLVSWIRRLRYLDLSEIAYLAEQNGKNTRPVICTKDGWHLHEMLTAASQLCLSNIIYLILLELPFSLVHAMEAWTGL